MLTIETEKTQQALLDKGIEGVPAQAQHVGSPYLQHPALAAQGDLTQLDPGARLLGVATVQRIERRKRQGQVCQGVDVLRPAQTKRRVLRPRTSRCQAVYHHLPAMGGLVGNDAEGI